MKHQLPQLVYKFFEGHGWYWGVAFSFKDNLYQVKYTDDDGDENESIDTYVELARKQGEPPQVAKTLLKKYQQSSPAATETTESSEDTTDESTETADDATATMEDDTETEEEEFDPETVHESSSSDDSSIIEMPRRRSRSPVHKPLATRKRKVVLNDTDEEDLLSLEEEPEDSDESSDVNMAEVGVSSTDDDDDDKPRAKPSGSLNSWLSSKSKSQSKSTKAVPHKNKKTKNNKKSSTKSSTKSKLARVSVSPRAKPPVKKKQKTSSKKKPQKNASQVVVKRYDKKPYAAGKGLPVLSEPQDMFDDMIAKTIDLDKPNMLALLDLLEDRPLKIATMCSGTESPVLALDMIQNAIRRHLGRNFPLAHFFSCEIEPFKQAYIERNFHPPLLFRDIRELGEDQAYTAYGGLVDVPNQPGSVDILIAGTSCVDYSNLNTQKKTMEEQGESGATFLGMMRWIDKAQPPIVIIENVFGAPWPDKKELFEERGYVSDFVKLDTKDFYIPHTRQRGYLVAVKNNGKHAPQVPEKWKAMVEKLKRPASASLDSFMLSNDDPRVLRGRGRLTAESSTESHKNNGPGRVDWSRCESRHMAARALEELGDRRPFTGWSESGNITLPGFCWNEWAAVQVPRIHDLMDINTLRLAQVGVDPTHKTMVWNLSQNVDRDTMGRLGLCQCLTPTGVPYVTSRGGPMVGEELLKLQGIPADDLLLTKETEDNLKDLAGNAMSTTVVGACAFAALLLGHRSLLSDDAMDTSSNVSMLVPRALGPPTPIAISRSFGEYAESTLTLAPLPLLDTCTWDDFLRDAKLSSRMCINEGPEEVLPTSSLVQCSSCGLTANAADTTPLRKYEEHNFVPMDSTTLRVDPSKFRERLIRLLPMRFSLQNFGLDELKRPTETAEGVWKGWIDAVSAGIDESFEADAEFQLEVIRRSNFWTAHYSNGRGARAEARVFPDGMEWLVFVDAINRDADVQFHLKRPFARLRVEAPTEENGSSWSSCLTRGVWQISLPVTKSVTLHFEGVGENYPSWRNRLGLVGGFETEHEPRTLRVRTETTDDFASDLSSLLDGDYDLLPKCGAPCGSLRKNAARPLFFYLHSGRDCLANEDGFVFTKTCHRTGFGEYRETLAEVDRSFRPLLTTKEEGLDLRAQAYVHGVWTPQPGATMFPTSGAAGEMVITQPVHSLDAPIHKEAWKEAYEIVSCRIHVPSNDDLRARCLKVHGGVLEVNLQKSKRVFGRIAFALSRISIPSATGEWTQMDRHDKENNKLDALCQVCAPTKPRVKWIALTKGKKKIISPIEDGKEAASYERAMKSRPSPWILRLQAKMESGGGSFSVLDISVGANMASLVQQVLGMLPADSPTRRAFLDLKRSQAALAETSHDWRIVPHFETSFRGFPKLRFTSNKKDIQAQQPPNFKSFGLRKEQLRSLQWMLNQESSTVPFMEEEVAEAVLPGLKWRAEGRVRRPVLVRGGIIADEVGYGKTAITLGLIDSSMPSTDTEADKGEGKSHVTTRATLVVVPQHLMGQWPKEVKKFLGKSKKVVIIQNMNSMMNLSISDILKADIVFVSFAVLSHDKYFSKLARLSGICPDSLPTAKKGGRYFDAVYGECLQELPRRVGTIIGQTDCAYGEIQSAAKAHESLDKSDSVRLDGKKASYKNGQSAGSVRLKKMKLESSEKDPWKLSGAPVHRDWKKMQCPPIEMFKWERVVVDEFTYLFKKDRERVLSVVKNLRSTNRWFLSGTPKHCNFDDISALSDLLGIHLGVPETLPGTKLSKRYLQSKESTGLESLTQYLEEHSLHWHERRHEIAQAFLDRFVRQNIAEIDEIPYEEHEVLVDLPPVEKAIYLELETHLKSLEMNSKNALKSKRKSTGDRESRMQVILQESQSAEEALLKCCSHFNLRQGASTAIQTIEGIIELRELEKSKLETEIVSALVRAFRLRQDILYEQPDWSAVKIALNGDIPDELEVYLKQVDSKKCVPSGADDEVNSDIAALCLKAKSIYESSDNGDSDEESGSSEELAVKKITLRESMHQLRAMSKEYCGRVRSLRYIRFIRRFQKQDSAFKCERCSSENLLSSQIGVLSSCGHSGRLECLRECAGKSRCIAESCAAQVTVDHIVPADKIGLEEQSGAADYYFGKKLTVLVETVKEIIAQDDRMIIFCQFDDLQQKVKDALAEFGIDSMQVKGTVQQQIKAVEVFQTDRPSKKDPRVLMLKMDDEQSAGLNLTNLNHALFVHPLLADSQAEYNAYETQAIGRIRRYGQKKKVNVWRFLARDTIDMDIYEEKTKQT